MTVVPEIATELPNKTMWEPFRGFAVAGWQCGAHSGTPTDVRPWALPVSPTRQGARP